MSVETDSGGPSVVLLTKKSKRRVVPVNDVITGKVLST
jgi:hypothetical protein